MKMFKANPSKSMSEHITSMAKGKPKKGFFGKKSKGNSKGKFNLFKKQASMVDDSDHDDEFVHKTSAAKRKQYSRKDG